MEGIIRKTHLLPEWRLAKQIIPWKERCFSMMLMIKMLPDCTDMTKADNRIIDSITTNSSQYNKTSSDEYLEEISPQSKALCRGDWGLCHQQAKVQMSDICPACNFSFHCFIKFAESWLPQTLINSCVQPGGVQFFPLSEGKSFLPESIFRRFTKMITNDYLYFSTDSQAYICWLFQSGGCSFRLPARERGFPEYDFSSREKAAVK